MLLVLALPLSAAQDLPLSKIKLPPGFAIGLYARVPGARSLALGRRGTLFVGTREEGKVYALIDRDGDHRAEQAVTLAQGLTMPNGVAFREGALYVAELSRVIRFDRVEERLASPPQPVVVNASFPTERAHGWKFIAFGPDGLLYVPIGMPCNICESKDERFGTIRRLKPDGSGLEIYAPGVRNSVGFDWQPNTGVLWFTDNGRDWLGDDLPPDELNRAPRPGLNFGFPYCYGQNVPDPLFAGRVPRALAGHGCRGYTPPARELGPHVAALGMRFYTGQMFPQGYRGCVFIAEHGSWNRSTPIGYRLTLVRVEGERALSYEVFAEGWLQGRSAWGRPVDVLVMPDGSLLVSDDLAGAVYRISYGGGAAPSGPGVQSGPKGGLSDRVGQAR